jgi:hypothetical protein
VIMQASPSPALHISRAEYKALRARENASCAALAIKWGVEAVGRDYPLHLSRAGPAVAGEWYVIRERVRRNTTAAQARKLNRVGRYGVHAIGPIYATEASTKQRAGVISWGNPCGQRRQHPRSKPD